MIAAVWGEVSRRLRDRLLLAADRWLNDPRSTRR